MKLIYKAGSIIEANIITGLLQSRGIEAQSSGFYLQGGIGDLAAMDFANVHVPNDDAEEACKIISEYEGIENNTEETITSSRKTLPKTLLVLLTIVLLVVVYYLVTL